MENYIETPIQGLESFDGTSQSHIFSQAALLLCIGRKMHEELREARKYPPLNSIKFTFPKKTLDMFPLPKIESPSLNEIEWFAAQKLDPEMFRVMKKPGFQEALLIITQIITQRLYDEPTYEVVLLLLKVTLQHKNELTRVAAAFACLAGGMQSDYLLDVLADAIQSDDLLIRQVSATALASFSPTHNALNRMMMAMDYPEQPRPQSHTSFIVHGTWARSGTWWRPGGDFHSYVLNNVRSDLYAAPDRYDWSGGYSDQARQEAADALYVWANQHQLDRPVIFSHSHGGSVCMLASQQGLILDKLILLSCPEHIQKYTPNYSNISKIISIRVHLDLVILADFGGQSFNGQQQIEEHFLPIWFNHSATYDPDVWKKYGVPTWI